MQSAWNDGVMGLSISVIVVTLNRFEALRQTLTDLNDQTRPADEFIVVDQSRDDDGAPLNYAERLSVFPRVRYFHHAVANAQKARNRAILESRGDILIFVDDDVRLPPDFVEKHLYNYKTDETIDGVAGQTLDVGQEPTSAVTPSCSWPGNGWMFFPLNYAKRCPTINWPSCNASIRRNRAIQVGGFDEQFVRTKWDDTDFSWRLHQARCNIVFDPLATLVHLKVPSGGKRPSGLNPFVLGDTEHWGTLFYFWRKNFGLVQVWRHVAIMLRGMIARRVFLFRPHWLLIAVYHVVMGYRWASLRLRQGPIYLPGVSVKARAMAPPLAAHSPPL